MAATPGLSYKPQKKPTAASIPQGLAHGAYVQSVQQQDREAEVPHAALGRAEGLHRGELSLRVQPHTRAGLRGRSASQTRPGVGGGRGDAAGARALDVVRVIVGDLASETCAATARQCRTRGV